MRRNLRDDDRAFQSTVAPGETTGQTLLRVINQTQVRHRLPPLFDTDRDLAGNHRWSQQVDCNEVYPRIYIGDGYTAKNIPYLKQLGVTHVLNAAEGYRLGFVNTNRDYYKDSGIEYLGLPIADLPSFDISPYFNKATEFIHNAFRNGGVVYVHCVMGVSRSATCVIAYLMMKHNMTAEEACRTVRLNRDVHPNEGFLHQLAKLDCMLRPCRRDITF